jgi:hypothetical protein
MGLHHAYAGDTSYMPKVTCPTYSHTAVGSIPAQEEVPVLDVAASEDHERSFLSIMVVNRHAESSVKATIAITGFPLGDIARVFRVGHVCGFGDLSSWYDDPAYDSVGQRDRTTVPAVWCAPKMRKAPQTQVEELPPIPLASEFTLEFSAHSFTVLVCPLPGGEK